ncbi:MAG TPA: hypothetical protein VF103_14365, partial [Polyangiaceae bacterium]
WVKRVGFFGWLGWVAGLTGGCAQPEDPSVSYGLGGDGSTAGGFAGVGGSFGGGGFDKGGFAGSFEPPRTDDTRPVVTAEHTPPPISGGTLLALAGGGVAVASDPDRDRIVVVDTTSMEKTAEIALEAGAEPGRLVEDADGFVHVALRGTGEIVTLDPDSGEIVERRAVCRAPRGLAFDRANDAIIVACLEGTLVELPASGGEATRATALAPDLRDVVFLGSTLVVTRFRSAEILYLDVDRNITRRVTPDPSNEIEFQADVAWRAVAGPGDKLFMTHQRAFSGAIDVGGSGGSSGDDGIGKGANGPRGDGAYGFGGPCGAIVQGTISTADPNGDVVQNQTFDTTSLPVDVAVSKDSIIAVANAAYDPSLPQSTFQSSLIVFSASDLTGFSSDCGVAPRASETSWTTTAVAFDPVSGGLLVQTREPSQILVYDERWVYRTINLGGADVTDTGHQIFHTDANLGVSCASCHAEGTDDGHVWNFTQTGARRTQSLDVGLEGTAPFHWDGALPTFGDLVSEVFQRRMGGPTETPERTAALESFVYGLKRRPPARAADDEAALRGKIVFESEDAACTGCHTGEKFSNGKNESVGKGVGPDGTSIKTQVPSLIGVSARLPLMHDGCAQTLAARFDPTCGGDSHGHPELLDQTQLDDLVAYLETL